MRRLLAHPIFPEWWMAAAAGVGALYVAAVCFEDAWEGRGGTRPRFAKMLPV